MDGLEGLSSRSKEIVILRLPNRANRAGHRAGLGVHASGVLPSFLLPELFNLDPDQSSEGRLGAPRDISVAF